MHILKIGLEGYPENSFRAFRGEFRCDYSSLGVGMSADEHLSIYNVPSWAYWKGGGQDELRSRGNFRTYIKVYRESDKIVVFEGAISSIGSIETMGEWVKFRVEPKGFF